MGGLAGYPGNREEDIRLNRLRTIKKKRKRSDQIPQRAMGHVLRAHPDYEQQQKSEAWRCPVASRIPTQGLTPRLSRHSDPRLWGLSYLYLYPY